MGSGKIDFSINLGRDFTHFSKFLFWEGGEWENTQNNIIKTNLTESQPTFKLNGKGYAFVRALQILNTLLQNIHKR